MSPDLALLSTLIGSNYPCLELVFKVPKVFEPLKCNCIMIYIQQCIASKSETYSVASPVFCSIMFCTFLQYL